MAEVGKKSPTTPSVELPTNDTKELKQWLTVSNCQQYYSKFIDNGITYDLLPELDTEALKEIGVTKVGDRLKLEIAIGNMKAESLKKVINVDELYSNLNLLNLTSPNTVNMSDYAITSENTLIQQHDVPNTSSTTLNLGGNMESKSSNKNITFILADGSLKKVNVTGCFNAQSIKRKVLRKLGIKQQENLYDTYIHNNENNVTLLYDVELVTICYSPDRLEKHRIILCEKDRYPTETALEVSKKIMTKYDKFNKQKQKLQQYHLPEKQPTMRQFFGQRPPSELISSNLAEYFPEAHQRELEQSVRNSVRYSVRLSRRFQGLGMITGSNLSVNKRLSNATMKYHSPSISSGEHNILAQRRVPARTIGDMMVNNVNAIEEVVNYPMFPDNQSIFSKPSIHSSDGASINSPFQDLRPINSNNSKNLHNHRVSIAASFLDQNNDNNRLSRIELLNVESDEEDYDDYGDDLISQYGDSDNPLFELSEDGPKNWLKGARIGAGSFGTVYLGMSPFTGELMAVKQVSIAENNSELQQSMISALQHEMSLLKNLDHENIVRYLGSSISDDNLNIFLEYVPGGSVQTMLMSYGPFEEPLIRNFIRQVLIGLSYLHGEDIIHRDIKGANILIDIKGTVKISDFGISKKLNSKKDDDEADKEKPSRRASLQGSVYWMAPEVVKQTAYTKKADIWSVGCLIVEMFTGKHPFPNFSQMQAIFKIGTHVSPSIPEWCTTEAKEFLEKTFELEYENRPDAVELLADTFLNPLIMSKQ